MACWEFLCYICVDFSFYTPLDLILRQAQGFGSLAIESMAEKHGLVRDQDHQAEKEWRDFFGWGKFPNSFFSIFCWKHPEVALCFFNSMLILAVIVSWLLLSLGVWMVGVVGGHCFCVTRISWWQRPGIFVQIFLTWWLDVGRKPYGLLSDKLQFVAGYTLENYLHFWVPC